MAKFKVFIGSSVEGKNIAYAVQQNLLHDAEVTVWSQGIFDLSATTIESLIIALQQSDFAVFVFSPDDLTTIREATNAAVRDNVLFEFGLFIGKLGRERVFFLIPDSGVFRLPTDLLGITPGKYESNRSDKNLQAATGGVSFQIKTQMVKCGSFAGRIDLISCDEGISPTIAKSKESWIAHYISDRFDDAKKCLQLEMQDESGDALLGSQAWIIQCEQKARGDGITADLEAFALKNSENEALQITVAGIFQIDGNEDKAITILLAAKKQNTQDTKIGIALAEAYYAASDKDRAISELVILEPSKNPAVAIALAGFYKEAPAEALSIIQKCFAHHPSNKSLKEQYARLAAECSLTEVALYLWNNLCMENSKSSDYWGNFGNVALSANLFDQAMICYRKAETLEGSGLGSQWIKANIGNLLSSKGFPTESIKYFEAALSLSSDHEYSHDRLATALKAKSAEQKLLDGKREEGKKAVRARSVAILTDGDKKLASDTHRIIEDE